MNDLEWLYNAINVRSDYARVWWDDEPTDIKRLGMTLHRSTAFGMAEFVGTNSKGKVFEVAS